MRPIPLVAFFLMAASAGVEASLIPPLVVFDEDDPLCAGMYDASHATARPPATLARGGSGGDKLPVRPGPAASGSEHALLEWDSGEGGSWTAHIFRPGFETGDLTRHQSLALSLNGPSALTAEALPLLALESYDGATGPEVPLGRHLSEGLDALPGTWQRISIPLAELEFSNLQSAKRFKAIRLRSGEWRGRATLWVDSVQFEPKPGELLTTPPMGRADDLRARTGDRSVALHWSYPPEPGVSGFHVYRSESKTGPFERASGKPAPTASFADSQVENGKQYHYQVRAVNANGLGEASETVEASPAEFEDDNAFLDYVAACAFDYFIWEANPRNGLIRDRSQPFSPASVAAMGFGLTAHGIGVERCWLPRAEAAERTLTMLRTLRNLPRGESPAGAGALRGWFYHFLDMETGTRHGRSELSSIDTALLMAGVLFAREFFDGETGLEREIRSIAEGLFNEIDWQWMLNGGGTLSHGWHPESGFIPSRWVGYNEASLLYLLALGAAKNPLPAETWSQWTAGYTWETHHGRDFVPFDPLFGHQYTQCWVDMRHINDAWMGAKGITYFENSRRATLAQRQHGVANPLGHPGYGADIWGWTACDGPGSKGFHGYIARGVPPIRFDDGTIAPTAAGGSVVFAPEECVAALRAMYDRHREKIWCGYGFRDAFNIRADWWGPDVIGIDQGPILLMIDNLQRGTAWRTMRQSAVIRRGLERAGFKPVSPAR